METTDRNQQHKETWAGLVDEYAKLNDDLNEQLQIMQSLQQTKTDPGTRNMRDEPTFSACDCSLCIEKEDKNINNIPSLPTKKPEKENLPVHKNDIEEDCGCGSANDLPSTLPRKDFVDSKRKMDEVKTPQRKSLPRHKNDVEQLVFKECECNNKSDATNNLLEENQRLTDELQDLKLEMKQCMEKINGPINRQIEKEKTKNKSLEKELVEVIKDSTFLRQTLTTESDELKQQLEDASRKLSEASALNKQLQDAIAAQKTRCEELGEALIDQKLAEAEMLKELKSARNRQSQPPSFVCPLFCKCPGIGSLH